MNNSVLSKDAQLLLKNLFMNKLVQLESKSEKGIVFSKQLEIGKLRDKVDAFIERNPFGKFEIRVLDKHTENIEDYKYALVVKNYKHEESESRVVRPTLFIIVIDNAFDTVDFYQMSLNNILMPV